MSEKGHVHADALGKIKKESSVSVIENGSVG
jgi:hypothetical protein